MGWFLFIHAVLLAGTPLQKALAPEAGITPGKQTYALYTVTKDAHTEEKTENYGTLELYTSTNRQSTLMRDRITVSM